MGTWEPFLVQQTQLIHYIEVEKQLFMIPGAKLSHVFYPNLFFEIAVVDIETLVSKIKTMAFDNEKSI